MESLTIFPKKLSESLIHQFEGINKACKLDVAAYFHRQYVEV